MLLFIVICAGVLFPLRATALSFTLACIFGSFLLALPRGRAIPQLGSNMRLPRELLEDSTQTLLQSKGEKSKANK